MRALPPGLPPHIATHAINLQQQQEALRQLGLSQQNGAPGQLQLEQPVLMPGPNAGIRMAAVIGGLRIAFVVVRLVAVAAVLWIMWRIFAPY